MVNHICEPISSNQFASCSSARVGQGGGGAPLTMGGPKMRLQHRSWLRTPLVMWLGLAISLTLLCVSNTVLAHDIYSDLHDRDGRLCCNGQDCKPVQVTVLPNGSYYLPSTGEIIPADMATPSPKSLSENIRRDYKVFGA